MDMDRQYIDDAWRNTGYHTEKEEGSSVMKNITSKSFARKSFRFILIIAAIFILYAPFHAEAVPIGEVEEGLGCFGCSCKPVTICRSSCGEQMKKEIERMVLQEGKTKEQIFDYYAKKYGVAILTEPPKSGFNLVAYIVPFATLLIGIVVALLLVKKWGHSAETSGKDVYDTTLSSEMQKKIDDELSKLEEDE
jgi:cytochrome c-type biogenesis protein CcmH